VAYFLKIFGVAARCAAKPLFFFDGTKPFFSSHGKTSKWQLFFKAKWGS
jgi:hypothetical protein